MTLPQCQVSEAELANGLSSSAISLLLRNKESYCCYAVDGRRSKDGRSSETMVETVPSNVGENKQGGIRICSRMFDFWRRQNEVLLASGRLRFSKILPPDERNRFGTKTSPSSSIHCMDEEGEVFVKVHRGTLFAFGSNFHGQLGCGPVRGDLEWSPRPVRLMTLKDVRVQRLCSGLGGHTVAVTSENEIFQWGHYEAVAVGEKKESHIGTSGRVVEEDFFHRCPPSMRVHYDRARREKIVPFGASRRAGKELDNKSASPDDGTGGDHLHKECSTIDPSNILLSDQDNFSVAAISTPTPLSWPTSRPVEQIAAGVGFTIIRSNGDLYGLGFYDEGGAYAAEHGVLLGTAPGGHASRPAAPSSNRPFSLLDCPPGLAGQARDVACGSFHVLCVGVRGTVFAWGRAEGGQLGLDPVELECLLDGCEVVSRPQKLSFVDRIMQDVDHDPITTAKLDEEIVCEEVDGRRAATEIVSVSCGEAHSCAVDNEGCVWVWGLGEFGQLGLGISSHRGDLCRVFTPKKLSLDKFNGKPVSRVRCGGAFTVAVTRRSARESGGIMITASASETSASDTSSAVDDTLLSAKNPMLGANYQAHDVLERTRRTVVQDRGSLRAREEPDEHSPGDSADVFPGDSEQTPFSRAAKNKSGGGLVFPDAYSGGGQVFAWGANERCQCGLLLNGSTEILVPKHVLSLAHTTIVDVSCGLHHSVAVDRAGRVYTWGAGDHGQLGTMSLPKVKGKKVMGGCRCMGSIFVCITACHIEPCFHVQTVIFCKFSVHVLQFLCNLVCCC